MITHELVITNAQPQVIPLLWTGKEEALTYNVVLEAKGSSIVLTGLLLGNKQTHLDLTINVTHREPNTTSRVAITGVLMDETQVNVEGLVKINAGAKQSN